MSDIGSTIKGQMPENYAENYPRFVAFLEAYYNWLSRREGFSEAEIEVIAAEKNWLTTNIEKYMMDNRHRFSGLTDEATFDYALIEESNILLPEAALDRFVSGFLLERTFDFMQTNDDYQIQTADGYTLDAPYFDQDILTDWFYKLGLGDYTVNRRDVSFNDDVLLIRLLKHIHAIKGTHKSIELFFNIYFNEQVEIYLPKENIAAIDDNFILDGVNTIRDDYYYNEFSYVIRVKDDPAKYQELIDKVYLKYFHPAGFKMFLEQKTAQG